MFFVSFKYLKMEVSINFFKYFCSRIVKMYVLIVFVSDLLTWIFQKSIFLLWPHPWPLREESESQTNKGSTEKGLLNWI